MAFSPLNDLAMVRLDSDEYGFGGGAKTTSESGILVELPEEFTYFGMWSFAFENSLMNKELLVKLHKHWKAHIGHRVYWTALSEKGNIISKGKDRFAFVKLTSLIAFDTDPTAEGENVHAEGAGTFNMAEGVE